MALFLFFAYGPAYQVLKAVTIAGAVVGRHRLMVPLWVGVFAVGCWWIVRRRQPLAPLTRWANVVSVAALLIPCATILVGEMRAAASSPIEHRALEMTLPQDEHAQDDLPDVYYIILDSYARGDIYADMFDHNNAAFIDGLRGQGFYVAEESNANYIHTHLSLASSLNMGYLQDLMPGIETQAVRLDRDGAIRHSLVRRTFEAMGYRTVAFATGWSTTEIFDSDIVLTPGMTEYERLSSRLSLTPFESMLLSASAARLLLDLDSLRNTPVSAFIAGQMRSHSGVQRDIILGIFDNLSRVPDIPGPKFVFSHIVSPHAPYLFAADGTYLWPEGPFTLVEDIDLRADVQRDLYVGQSVYVETRVQEVIQTILETSTRPVIIVVQSDHGPRYGEDWVHPDADTARARAAILNAYYLPRDCEEGLYPAISPVNTFRVVFACIAGNPPELLEDRSYYGWENGLAPLDSYLQ
jgi:hypothetical protein